MKHLLLLFLLFCFFSANAQYNVNWAEAPLNEIPLKYKKEHFNLKGPIKNYQLVGNQYFNKQGFLMYGNSLSLQFEFTYDANHKPLTYSSWLSDSYRPVYRLDIDANGRIIGKKYETNDRYFEKYTYDANGNWTGITEEYGGRKTLNYSYTYDAKNRVIKAEYYTYPKTVGWEDSFSYARDGAFVVVTTSRKYLEYSGTNFIKTHYYKNGVFYGEKKNDNVKYDKYGNGSMSVFGNGDSVGYSMANYIYYGDAGVSDDVMENSTATKKEVNTDSNCTQGNCIDGYGTYTYDNGTYTGFFVNGKKEDYGSYTWSNGDNYSGIWKNNEVTGFGVLESKKGFGYKEGIWKNGKLDGLGINAVANAKFVYGSFTNNQLIQEYKFDYNTTTTGCTKGDCSNGFGNFEFDNDTWFFGFFKNGNMLQGYWKGLNSISYKGQFGLNNTFEGMGTYTFANGDYYAGNFKENKRNGRGVFYYNTTKKVQAGEWKDDVLIKEYKF